MPITLTQHAKDLLARIKELDPNIHIMFSDTSWQFYVSTTLETTNFSVASGFSEHADSPSEAVERLWKELGRRVKNGEYVKPFKHLVSERFNETTKCWERDDLFTWNENCKEWETIKW
jgi:hypothetical protein